MSSGPDFKVIVPFTTIYTLCLFLPAIDMLATYTLNLFSYPITIGVAALIFPAIYPLSDSITEVYGKRVAWYMVTACYVPAIIISLINNVLLSTADNHHLYDFLLQPSLAITIMGPIAYLVTAYINVSLISKLKMKMRGKHFVIRSFICSGLSGAITSIIVLPVAFFDHGFNYITSIYAGSVLTKMLITIPFVFLARILVGIYRLVEDKNEKPYNTGLILNIDNTSPRA